MAKLTQKGIERYKNKSGKRETLSDGSGLQVRVGTTNNKVYYFRYKIAGKTKYLKLGNHPLISLADARIKVIEHHNQLQQGFDPSYEIEDECDTFDDLADLFIRRHVNKNLHRPDIPTHRIKKHIRPSLGHLKLAIIKPRHITVMLDRIIDGGSSEEANKILQLTKQIFRFGIGRGVLEMSPAEHLSPPSKRAPTSGQRALTFEELKTLVQALDNQKSMGRRLQILTLLLILTGSRKGALLNAEKSHFDLDKKVWTIPPELTKTGRGRVGRDEGKPHRLPLSDWACELVKEAIGLSDDSDYLFPSTKKSGTFNATSYNNRLKELVDQLELGRVTPHTFRHTFTTRMADLKVPPYIVEKLVNHRMSGIMAVYNHAEYWDEQVEAMERWSERLILLVSSNEKLHFLFA